MRASSTTLSGSVSSGRPRTIADSDRIESVFEEGRLVESRIMKKNRDGEFEKAWQDAQPRPIDEFLPDEGDPVFLATLEELLDSEAYAEICEAES